MENTSMSNMVEHKRLDYNAPLLSVRRFASPAPTAAAASSAPSAAATTVPVVTSTTSGSAEDGGGAAAGEGWLRRYSLPFYRSELKSGPVSNPGVVPFVWEQSPGRPKDGSPAGSGSGDGAGSPQKPPQRQPAVVASASPATAASTSTPSSAETCLATSTQRSVEGSKVKSTKAKKPTTAEAQALEEDGGGSDEEDGGDDAFSDARAESCFMNCSTSGLSGGTAVRDPSGSFSTDAEVREFMMDRFLPAAQALTGSPQLAARKPPARRTLVDGAGRRPVQSPVPPPYPHRHRPRYAMYDAVGYHNVGFSGGDDGGGRLVKGRGWLPRLCLKGSLCLLSPIPAMKVSSGHSTVNCSDRRSAEFTEAGSRGGFAAKAFAKSPPLQCQGSVLVPAPGDDGVLCSIERRRPCPAKEPVSEDGAPIRTDRAARGCRADSGVEEHGRKKKGGDGGAEDLLLPPALPKSPSDSWLCQTLPTVLSRNPAPPPFLGVQLQSKNRATSADPRWEAMAKTSAMPKCRMRFAEVLSKPADGD